MARGATLASKTASVTAGIGSATPPVALRGRALSAAGIVPNITAQVSVSLTGIMLARHGAGIALVEPLLVASMGLPGTVTRPLKPRIEVKTLLIRHKTTPHSKVMNEFLGHLGAVVAAEPGQ